MRIAVTGAGGTVGGQVVELLAAEPEHEVVGLARRELRSSLAPTVLADYAVTYGRTEEALRASGCGFSIARASLFAEFFLRWLRPGGATGQIRVPAGDGRISLVSRVDVARCLAALALRGPTGRAHPVTGPEALRLDEVAARCAGAWGRRVE